MGLLPAEAQRRRRAHPVRARRLLTMTPAARRKLRGARHEPRVPGSVLGAQPVAAHRRAGRRRPRPPPRLQRAQARLRARSNCSTRSASPSRRAWRDAYPHELSGGMRQRALIAGALAPEPELLILDEPTTALDVTIEAQILDLLETLRDRRGLTMLFISHNLGVVRRIADEVAVLYAGQVVEQGRTGDVLRAPMHPYTKGLLAAIPRLGRDAARARRHSGPAARPARSARRLPVSSRAARSRRRSMRGAAGADRSRRTPRALRQRADDLRDAAWPRRGRIASRRRAAAATRRADRRWPAACQDRSRCPAASRPDLRGLAAALPAGAIQRRRRRVADHRAPARCWGWSASPAPASPRSGRTILRLIEPTAARSRIAGEDRDRKAAARARADAARGADRVPEPRLLAQPAQDRGARSLGRPLARFGLAAERASAPRVSRRCSTSCGCRRTTPTATPTR